MDMESLIDEAKQTMLTDGKIMPMLYLQLSQDTILFALDVLSDGQSIPAQCGILARLGWEHGKQHPGQKPVSAGFYCEAWRLVEPEASAEEKMRPARSEKRQEIISVAFWQADKEPRMQTCALPVVRDHKKRVIDVTDAQPTSAGSLHLVSFLRGVLDSQKPDDEVFGKLDRQISERIAALSPEKRAELMEYIRREGLR